MSRYLFCGFAVIALVASVNTEVRAQSKQRVVTISEVTIVGRVQKPIAAVDVSRIQPRLTLGNKKQPFVDKIEKAIQEPPF
jgi:hypothetical protein